MIRFFASLLLLLSAGFPLLAQSPVHCATDLLPGNVQMHEYQLRHLPNAFAPRGGTIYIIPVVVHIIQETNAIQIPDGRVLEQIKALNEDFRKQQGTPGDGSGVDTYIEFRLATIDPNGCPTTGITRTVSPGNAWHSMADEAQLKAVIQWDPEKYLNIWVPKVITGGILGYARFPYTLSNDPQLDGCVINGNFFGRNFGITPSAYDQGRTATHEVGHWLGLFHTFQGGCAGMDTTTCDTTGDWVCDTPPTSSSNFGCPGTQNTCNESPVDLPDQTLNYMDYTNDLCMNMYTQGQTDRMQFFLNTIRTQLWQASNLTATGVDGTVSPGCTPIAAFDATHFNICSGSTIQFTDVSQGPATAWQWSFPGGSPSTSASADPSVTYANPGSYDVTLIVTNSFGSDTIFLPGYVTVTNPFAPIYTESFDTAAALPAGWYIVNPDQQGAWHRSTVAAAFGQASMVFDNYTDSTAGGVDDLISLPLDLGTMGAPELHFYYAHKRFNAFRQDSLKVLVSSDCGATWNVEWSRTGGVLATVTGWLTSAPYVPANADWRWEVLSLADYTGLNDIRICFRNISRGGQAIWLDEISVLEAAGTDPSDDGFYAFDIAPNPSGENPFFNFQANANTAALNIYSLAGQLLYTGEIPGQTATWQLPADVFESLPSGMMLVKVSDGARSGVLRWVKL